MTQTRPETTTVEIYGQTYNVRGGGNPTYLTELAQFVDTRMREVASQGGLAEPLKIAILAALNIADEFEQYRKSREGVVDRWMERTEELTERLDQIVEESELPT